MVGFELNSCPFCGGKAEYEGVSHLLSNQVIGFEFKIVCKSCGVSPPNSFLVSLRLLNSGDIKIIVDERQSAANVWNRRNVNEID